MKQALSIFAVGFVLLMNTVSYADALKGQTVSPAAQFNQLSYTNQTRLSK